MTTKNLLMKLLGMLMLALVIWVGSSHAQVAINTDGSDPHPSAMVDIKSTARGLLIPRMTQQQRIGINNPADGLLVYDISNETIMFFGNGQWNVLREVTSFDKIVDLDTDTRIEAEHNFDEDILRFTIGGTEHLYMDGGRINIANTGQSVFLGDGAGKNDDLSVNMNVMVGHNAGYNNSSGESNTAVGYSSMTANQTGDYNTALGSQSLQNNTGHKNTAIGFKTLRDVTVSENNVAVGAFSQSNTTGGNNTSTGTSSLFLNTSGVNNAAFGSGAMNTNQSGNSNSSVGFESLYQNTTGNSNVAVGIRALYQNSNRSNLVAIGDSALYKNGMGAIQSYEGTNNVAVGSKSLYDNKTGYSNTAVGSHALTNNDDGWKNTALGSYALNGNNGGSRNTAVGNEAMLQNNSGSYNTALGANTLRENTESYNTGLGAESLTSNTNGAYNTAGGYKALYSNVAGSENSAFGANTLHNNISGMNCAFGLNALFSNTEGSGNVAVGVNALFSNDGGSNNTAVGYGADVLDNNFSNATAIGYNAKAGQSNTVVIGNNDVKIGMAGISNPVEKLDVPGAIKIGNTDNTSPEAGTIRWNPDMGAFEGFDGNEWILFGGAVSSWGSNSGAIYGDESLLPSNLTDIALFGQSIDVSSESWEAYAIIGSSETSSLKGKAYIFKRDFGGWVQEAELVASDGQAHDKFGASVSISTQYNGVVYAIVGAPDAGNVQDGKAYIFERQNGSWSQKAILQASDHDWNDQFGSSVSIHDTCAIIGAPREGINNNGKAYLFTRNANGVWDQYSMIKPADIGQSDFFGCSIAINEDYVAIGANGLSSSGPDYYGKVYMYNLSNGSLSYDVTLTAAENDLFGSSLSLTAAGVSSCYLAVGAPAATINGHQYAGRAYIYYRNSGNWTLKQAVSAPDPENSNRFGETIDISFNGLVISEIRGDGMAYMFEKIGDSWAQTAKFYPPDPQVGTFGEALAMDEAYLLIGAPWSYPNELGTQRGIVYFFDNRVNY